MIESGSYRWRSRRPLALARKALSAAVAVCRNPSVYSAPLESVDARPLADSDPLERLETEFPMTETLGSYERDLLRGGLPVRVRGECNVCGHGAGFLLRSENFREDLVCPRCKASNRKRQVVAVLLSETGLPWQGSLARHADRLPQTIWVMETGPFAEAFDVQRLITSEYLSADHVSGRSYGGVRHEDVMAPSFRDESLDAVVSCDVFEHVPDPYAAHGKVFRCLKPGGIHVFTVPFHEHTARDEVRATVDNGVHRYHLPKIYHGDPRRAAGALVYRVFSIEMLTTLARLGYEVKLARVHSVRLAMLGANAVVFVARKPARQRTKSLDPVKKTV